MAEIKIERKKPMWPWIILALVILAGIIYYVMDSNRLSPETNMTPIDKDTIYEKGAGEDHYDKMDTDTTYSTPTSDKEGIQ